MIETIAEVMRYCRHYFPVDYTDGEWRLQGGVLTPEDERTDGLIAITGSAGHNGVWMLQDGAVETDTDETWHGRVWLLAPPEDFLALCREIDEWRQKHPVQAAKSEKFGEYQVSYAGADGQVMTWQDAFVKRLRPYLRMFAEVPL